MVEHPRCNQPDRFANGPLAHMKSWCEDDLEGRVALPPSSIICRNWGRSAILPLSASSTYSRATE